MTDMDCTTIDRGQLTWDWNNQYTIPVGEFTLVKPAGAHNNIQVIGTPDLIKIFSNGGMQDRTGQEYLNGDWGSDIQWVKLCTYIQENPVLPGPVFQWVASEPVLDCDLGTITIEMHEEAAGYYWGNDGEAHLGGFFPTGETNSKTIPATEEECPVIPVIEEPVEEPTEEVEVPVQEEVISVPTTPVVVAEAPVLAETGGETIAIFGFVGLALILTGVVTLIRKKRKSND